MIYRILKYIFNMIYNMLKTILFCINLCVIIVMFTFLIKNIYNVDGIYLFDSSIFIAIMGGIIGGILIKVMTFTKQIIVMSSSFCFGILIFTGMIRYNLILFLIGIIYFVIFIFYFEIIEWRGKNMLNQYKLKNACIDFINKTRTNKQIWKIVMDDFDLYKSWKRLKKCLEKSKIKKNDNILNDVIFVPENNKLTQQKLLNEGYSIEKIATIEITETIMKVVIMRKYN